MAVDIKIEIKNLPQIRKAFYQAPDLMTKNLNEAIRKSIFYLRERSVKEAPARTSRLRGSVYNTFSPLKGELGFRANYAVFVHEGTRAHFITPSTKKALFWKGASHPVKRVRHPGTRPNPFLRRAVEFGQKQVDQFFAEAVDKTLDKIAKDTK